MYICGQIMYTTVGIHLVGNSSELHQQPKKKVVGVEVVAENNQMSFASQILFVFFLFHQARNPRTQGRASVCEQLQTLEPHSAMTWCVCVCTCACVHVNVWVCGSYRETCDGISWKILCYVQLLSAYDGRLHEHTPRQRVQCVFACFAFRSRSRRRRPVFRKAKPPSHL